MITANTKITALEILNEVGIKKAEDVFGKMRVRIGGISGINKADHLIVIPANTTNLEVIVGNELYDLELVKGRNDIADVSEGAQAATEAKGLLATAQAEKLQQVKVLSAKIRESQDKGEEYQPTKAEEKILEEAIVKADADRENIENAKANRQDRKAIKVKSK
jgi:hypothetical protein